MAAAAPQIWGACLPDATYRATALSEPRTTRMLTVAAKPAPTSSSPSSAGLRILARTGTVSRPSALLAAPPVRNAIDATASDRTPRRWACVTFEPGGGTAVRVTGGACRTLVFWATCSGHYADALPDPDPVLPARGRRCAAAPLGDGARAAD